MVMVLLLMLKWGDANTGGNQAALLQLRGLDTSPLWPPWLGGLGAIHPSYVLAT